MSCIYKEYRFGRFQIDCGEKQLLKDGSRVKLERQWFEVLLLLIENAGRTVEKQTFFGAVWSDRNVEENSLRVTITYLRKALGDRQKNPLFIETVPGRGYRFIADVEVMKKNLPDAFVPLVQDNVLSKDEQQEIHADRVKSPETSYSDLLYLFIASLGYGFLYLIALYLETAYQYDRYRLRLPYVSLPLMAWICGTMFLAMVLTKNRAMRSSRKAFLAGIGLILSGAVLACLAASAFLPSESVTLSESINTQPASAAYFKNVFIYFLPLAVFVIYIPYHYVCFSEKECRNQEPDFFAIYLPPVALFIACLGALLYSLITTFYFLDKLLPSPNQSLFVILVFTRFVCYFGLALFCLLWYHRALVYKRPAIR